MATTNPLANLFGRNPFASLQEHMKAVMETADHVPSLFVALSERDYEQVTSIKHAIFASEDRADKIKNELRKHLPKGLFLPVDRRDLLEMLDMQDSIADVAQDIAGLLVERQMVIPDGMEGALLEYVRRCVDVCKESAKLISELDELLAMGFRGHEAERVEEMVSALNDSEEETDRMGLEMARTLFSLEETLAPVSVMFWYQLIQWIGDLADYAEKVGNRIRLMIAR